MPFGLKLFGHSARRSRGIKALMPSMPTCSPSPWRGGEGRGRERRLRLLSWGGRVIPLVSLVLSYAFHIFMLSHVHVCWLCMSRNLKSLVLKLIFAELITGAWS